MRKWLVTTLAALLSAATTHAADTALRDPTRPAGAAVSRAAAHGKLELTLIRLGAAPLAVINGKNVAPGETIDGYRLLSLRMTSATLAGPDGRTVLQLAPALHKTATTRSADNTQSADTAHSTDTKHSGQNR